MSHSKSKVSNQNSATLFIVFTLIMGGIFYWNSCSVDETAEKTVLEVENRTNDTVLVYLTLNQSDGYVNDVNGIFGISSTNQKQGSFKLPPKAKKSYTPPYELAINGNIAFIDKPLNCPYIGATLYEFNLNNVHTVVNAQETVDISCVAGVNSFGKINLDKGSGANWTDNVHPDPITKIKNKPLYENTGISGVFPYGCTNCTDTAGAPNCEGRPHYAKVNSKKICTVQRNASQSGGTVTIGYLGKP